MPLRAVRTWMVIGFITTLLAACGGGSGGGNSSSTPATSSNNSSGSTSNGSASSGSGSNSGSGITIPPPTPTVYSIQLTWSMPVTRADGSPITASELSGYRIYYAVEGTDASNDTVLPVSGGSTTALQITLSVAGTYTFAITALDQNGLESSLSAPISVPIN